MKKGRIRRGGGEGEREGGGKKGRERRRGGKGEREGGGKREREREKERGRGEKR